MMWLKFESVDGLEIVRKDQRKWREHITSVNFVNVKDFFVLVMSEIVLFNCLNTSLVWNLKQMFDQFIKLSIFWIGNGWNKQDKIFISKVLEKLSGCWTHLWFLFDAVLNAYFIISNLSVKIEVFWQNKWLGNVW